MKNIKIIVTIIALLILVFILNQNAFGCTMFKLTMYGKTMVGNNEDYWNPNSRIWFEHGKLGEYGAVYVGYDNFWPQGGMNQAGLVFDGFSMDYLAIIDTLGKKSLDANFLQDLMRKCANVDDVKKYFAQYNLTGLETSMFLFIDKTGKYLVVEGDSLITGNNQSYVLSNFYPSQIKEENEIGLPFYHKGKKLLDSKKDTTISFCSSVMDVMHQERNWGAGTMYTTIYDLKDGTIFLYFFRDYTHVVKFNLNQELKKMDYSLVIPDLFPENKRGQDFLNNYNAINSSLDLYKSEDILSDSIRYKNVTSILFKKDIKLISIFANKINEIGNLWMEKNNYNEAISVFKISVQISPDSWVTYSTLADAYLKNKQENLALINYEKSIELNPDYLEGRNHIEQLRRVLKIQTNANNR
jgi:tetratricopeptide (TPR) repeat protein